MKKLIKKDLKSIVAGNDPKPGKCMVNGNFIDWTCGVPCPDGSTAFAL